MLHRLSRCLSQCRVPSRASSSSVLYSWGASTATGCGTGRTADDGAEGSITVPGRISLPEPQMEPIKVAMGYAHSAVIVKGVDSIQLLVSGINTSYQLGADKEQIVDYFEVRHAEATLPQHIRHTTITTKMASCSCCTSDVHVLALRAER
eukprot:m.138099 g.138099  ORF g.138099 m.138099 type:complete len:150 (-) comp14008_c1_seq1:1585-2034(-)